MERDSVRFISAVIPAFNEAENIATTVRELIATLQAAGCGDRFEIIVVDDHSSDGTREAVRGLGLDSVRCLRLSRRSGSHTALRAGLAHAAGDAALCISADGQDNPAVLAQMIAKWQGGAEIVWALRTRREEPFMQKILAMSFYRVLESLVTTEKGDFDMARADFYLLGRRAVDAVNACSERNTSLFGLVQWLGFRQECVEYERRPRRAGESKWPVRRRLNLAWNWIIAFSGLPLRMITITGVVVALAGFVYAAFLIVCALLGRTIQGFATIVVLLVVLNGIQMIMLGLMGEYLWRNIEEARRRPLYFIESGDEPGGAGPDRRKGARA